VGLNHVQESKLMSVEVKWLKTGHILGVNMHGNIERIPFMLMDEQITQKLRTATTEQVHVIFNCTDLTGLPSYKVYRDSLFTYEDRLGWGVAYGNNSVTPFFINNFMTMHEMYFHLCLTYSEALQFLTMVDQRLANKVDLATLYTLPQ
jgi:hypothetical protein